MNTQFLLLDRKFLVYDTKFLVFNETIHHFYSFLLIFTRAAVRRDLQCAGGVVVELVDDPEEVVPPEGAEQAVFHG